MKSYAIRASLKEIAESIKLPQFFIEDEAEGMFKRGRNRKTSFRVKQKVRQLLKDLEELDVIEWFSEGVHLFYNTSIASP